MKIFIQKNTKLFTFPFVAYRTENDKKTFIYDYTITPNGWSSKLDFTQIIDYFEKPLFHV